MTQRLCELSKANNAKVVCFLEGGYNTKALSDSVLSTMNVLNAEGDMEPLQPVTDDQQRNAVDERIEEIRQHLRPYWQSLK